MTYAVNVAQGGSINTSFRNKVINGGFEIWQRPAATYTNWGSFSYLADRWRIGYDGTPASGRTLTQQTFAPGQTDVVDGDPKYYMEYTFPACGTPNNYLRNDIEGVRTLAGKTATLSFWVRTTSGTMSIGCGIAQEFGTGGSPSAGVYATPTTYTATTTWQKIVYTQAMPSIVGKTIGTNNDDRIWPGIYFPANSAGVVQIANVQLEEGSVATPFEKRPYSLELAMCQRYYYAPPQSLINYTSFHYSTSAYCFVTLPVTMRASPTVTFTGTGTTYYEAGASYTSSGHVGSGTQSGVSIQCTVSGGTQGYAGTFYPYFQANADL